VSEGCSFSTRRLPHPPSRAVLLQTGTVHWMGINRLQRLVPTHHAAPLLSILHASMLLSILQVSIPS
jgi:hypothetical protein